MARSAAALARRGRRASARACLLRAALEESNLFLIQNSQETEAALEELKTKFADTKLRMDADSLALEGQIESLKGAICVEEDKQLAEVVDELLKTEKNYTADVQMCVKQYLTPLFGILDAAAHQKIFSNLQQLYDLHVMLGADLAAAEKLPDYEQRADKIALSFKKVLPFFKMYSQYCHAYAGAPARNSSSEA